MSTEFTKQVLLQQLILSLDYGENLSEKLIELAIIIDSTGFEKFIQLYISQSFGIAVKHVGGLRDGGIDIIGDNMYIQAKKYQISKKYQKGILLSQVRDFYGAAISKEIKTKGYISKEKLPDMIFVTTSIFEYSARKFCEENGIKMWDNEYLIKNIIGKGYDLEWFKKQKGMQQYIKKYNLSLLGEQRHINIKDMDQGDYEYFFNQIKRKIYNIKRKPNIQKLNPDIIQKLIENRVSNLEQFYSFYGNLDSENKEILHEYGDLFSYYIKRLQELCF